MTQRKKRAYGLEKKTISMSVTPEQEAMIRDLGNGSPTKGLVKLLKHYKQPQGK